jgi:hypothetical protein
MHQLKGGLTVISELLVEPSIKVGELTIIPVSRLTGEVAALGDGGFLRAEKSVEAVILKTSQGHAAFNAEGRKIALSELEKIVPGINDRLSKAKDGV